MNIPQLYLKFKILLLPQYSGTSANEDNLFRNHIC
jgi:hypothetical protein